MPQWLRNILNWLQRLFNPKSAVPKPPDKPAVPQPLPPTPPAVPASTQTQTPLTQPTGSQPEIPLASPDPPQYRQRKSILTYRERTFFNALLRDIGGEFAVFAKVRLGDIFYLSNEPADRKYHNNQIQCKHFDFILCEKGSYRPLLAIELDDSSHDQPDHNERDEFKNRLCAQAGLPLWRLRIAPHYPAGYIRERVYHKLDEHGLLA
jgi:hypothetical protein